MKTTTFFSLALVLFFCYSCSEKEPTVVPSPLDDIITTHASKQNFTVVLTDMDFKEGEDTYYHKYKILVKETAPRLTMGELNDSISPATDIKVTNTKWRQVSPIIFDEHKNDLGMSILTKTDGVLDRNVTPAGMNGYVGNESYGSWEEEEEKTQQNTTRWHFYPRYYFMRSIFSDNRGGYGNSSNGFSRNEHTAYGTTYRGKRDFYGTKNQFTTATVQNNTNWSTKPQSFKDKVNSRVSLSANDLKKKGFISSKNYTKTTRNSSRYNSSSSSRSTSGGFGK